MIQQLLAITRNTFIESIRQPIFIVVVSTATLMLLFSPSLSSYTMDDDNKMMIDLGLSTLLVAGIFLAAFTAAGTLSAEIENRTVLTVVSKPIARPLFVVGKFAGVCTAMGVAYWILAVVFMLVCRHGVMQTASQHLDAPVWTFGLIGGAIALLGAMLANYFYQWVFTSTFVVAVAVCETVALGLVLLIDKNWHFQSPLVDLDGQLLIAMFMIFEALLVFAAVAVAASTRLGQIMTLMVCSGVYALGIVGHTLIYQFAADHVIAKVFRAFIPNLQYLWQSDALTQQHPIPVGHVLLVSVYCLFFLIAILSLAVALFQTREVG